MAEEKILTASELSEQERIRREKLQGLIESGNNPYEIMKYDVTHLSQDVIDHYEQLKETTVSMAGRMIGRHIMGKASFARLADNAGRICKKILIKKLPTCLQVGFLFVTETTFR